MQGQDQWNAKRPPSRGEHGGLISHPDDLLAELAEAPPVGQILDQIYRKPYRQDNVLDSEGCGAPSLDLSLETAASTGFMASMTRLKQPDRALDVMLVAIAGLLAVLLLALWLLN